MATVRSLSRHEQVYISEGPRDASFHAFRQSDAPPQITWKSLGAHVFRFWVGSTQLSQLLAIVFDKLWVDERVLHFPAKV